MKTKSLVEAKRSSLFIQFDNRGVFALVDHSLISEIYGGVGTGTPLINSYGCGYYGGGGNPSCPNFNCDTPLRPNTVNYVCDRNGSSPSGGATNTVCSRPDSSSSNTGCIGNSLCGSGTGIIKYC